MNELYSFYNDLYTDKTKCNNEVYFENYNVESKVDDTLMKQCEKDITVKELTIAVNELSLNKSPGSDGLTTNFYKFFWDHLKTMTSLLVQKMGFICRPSSSSRLI